MGLRAQPSRLHWELSLADIILALRRGWIFVLCCALLGLLGAVLLSGASEKGIFAPTVYVSTASVAPYGRDEHWAATMGVTTEGPKQPAAVATELETLVSSQFAKQVVERLTDHPGLADLTVAELAELNDLRSLAPAVFARQLNAFARSYTHIFDIEARATSAAVSALIANVAAQTYIDNRAEVTDPLIRQIQAQITSDISLLNDLMKGTAIEPTNGQLSGKLVPAWRGPVAQFQAGSLSYEQFRHYIWANLAEWENDESLEAPSSEVMQSSIWRVRDLLQSYSDMLPTTLPHSSGEGWLVSEATPESSHIDLKVMDKRGITFLIVATFIGMIIGLIIVIIHYLWSPLILNLEQQSDFLGVPALGHIARFNSFAKAQADLRELRTQLLISFPDHLSQSVMLTAPKIAPEILLELGVRLAESLAAVDKSVLILSCLPAPESINGAAHLFGCIDKEALPDAAVLEQLFPNVTILPRGPETRNPLDLFALPQFESVLNIGLDRYDVVMILAPSAPRGLSDALIRKRVNTALIVTQRARTTLGDLAHTIEILSRAAPERLFSVMVD